MTEQDCLQFICSFKTLLWEKMSENLRGLKFLTHTVGKI